MTGPRSAPSCLRASALFVLAGASAAQTVDTVGGTSNGSSGAGRAKGNSYEVTTSVSLTQVEFYLDFVSQQTLTTTVHGSPAEFGTYSEVFRSSQATTGTGPGWYSSGPINVALDAGKHYIVAVSWNGSLAYFYGVGDLQPVSFGSHTHGYAVGLDPLPAMFASNSNDQAIYHQRLTTVAGGMPIVYCTAGTTSHGCVPSIAGTGNPSASASSGFTVDVASIEGQKQGLFFYGVDNAGFAPLPWGPSSSWMCVKSPVQRTPVQGSGGTSGGCDGALSIDWNAFAAGNPGALGQPFAAGDEIFVQGWFRDPPSPKTTMLSDALRFVLGP
jgi:hypothetical protein